MRIITSLFGTRTAGVINGAVQKYVETSGANPNRVVFPTGDADGNYRPYSITFNDPAGDIGDLDTLNAVVGDADILLTASYSGASATGTNGLPIATTDAAGTSLNIGRYPAFHWNVSSNPSVSPSVDYDVEFEAAGYTNFAFRENINARGQSVVLQVPRITSGHWCRQLQRTTTTT